MKRKVLTLSFGTHSTAWLSACLCTSKQGTLRLNEFSEEACGIQ